jgi:hypothetical protein
MGRPRIVFFPHFEKTGGRSFANAVIGELGAAAVLSLRMDNDVEAFLGAPANSALAGVRFAYGHALYRVLDRVAAHVTAASAATFITLLRDPASRFQSMFDFQRVRKRIEPGPAAFLDRYAHNPYVMALGGGDLERAKARVEREFAFVGLTERFDYAVHVFRQILDLHDLVYHNGNRMPDGQKRLLPSDILARFADRNVADQALYDFVFAKQQDYAATWPQPAQYAFRFIDTPESWSTPTPVNLDIETNDDDQSCMVAGRDCLTRGETDKALAFFRKAAEINSGHMAHYLTQRDALSRSAQA